MILIGIRWNALAYRLFVDVGWTLPMTTSQQKLQASSHRQKSENTLIRIQEYPYN